MKKNSITKNYIYNLSYQILTIILPLITTPYLSRVLGADSVGIYGYTLSIVTYFILFGSLGVSIYGQREIAYNQEKKYDRSKIFYEILIMRFITLGVSLLLFYITFCINGEYSIYYKILTLEILATSLDISWFFQGLEEFKKTVLRHIIIKIISVISIFIFIKSKEDLIIYFFIYVLSNLLGNVSLWFYLPKFLCKVNWKDIKFYKHFKPTIALFIPQIAMQVYTVLDKTMLGNLIKDMTEVGNYEQSQKIIKLALTLVTALGTVMSPRIANTVAKNKKGDVENYLASSFNFVWFLGIPIMLGIVAVAKNMVPWFLGEEFTKSISILIVGSPIVLFIGLSNVIGIQYLIPAKKQKVLTISVIIGAAVNFICNLILIPIFKSIGAMVASVLAEFSVAIIQLLYIKKEISIKILYDGAQKYIVSGIIMCIFTYLLGTLLKPTISSTIIQIILGTIIYIIMLVILKDKTVFNFINKMKKKIFSKKQNSI